MQDDEKDIDGGYGNIVLAAISTLLFLAIGSSYAWGIYQARLLFDGVSSASSLAFVGSVSVACIAFFAIANSKILRIIGSRKTAILGVTLLSAGEVLSGFATESIGGLFATAGLLAGVGNSLCFTVASVVPAQYFRRRRGLAMGVVFASGGAGGAVMSLVIGKLLTNVGTAWTFRIMGLVTFGVCFPAVLFIRDRAPLDRSVRLVEWTLFKDFRFICILFAGAIGTLPLFVAPFWLPSYALTLGFSVSTAAALVAAFNVCSALGRLGFGCLCDCVGPLNSLISATLLSAISFLAIWPVSDSLAPLIVFVICNAAGTGGFFSCMPVCVASLFPSFPLPTCMGMIVTSWCGGYLMGPPIAGYLVDAYGGQNGGLAAYRPAMWYAGSLALASAAFSILGRTSLSAALFKKA